jgi:hypothetical protein
MSRTHQHRQQRVAYTASVKLHPRDRGLAIEGRSINLSRSGVLVESLHPYEVGTDLICELPLPGGDRRLPGRVTRLASLEPPAVALGIEFIGLAGPEEALLSEVVGEEDDGQTRRMVTVLFEGMSTPLRSRALVTDDGIRLSTTLPFLRVRSTAEVTFLSGDSPVHSRGLVRNVDFDQIGEDGAPRLAVDLQLGSTDPDATADDSSSPPFANLDEPSSPAPVAVLSETVAAPSRRRITAPMVLTPTPANGNRARPVPAPIPVPAFDGATTQPRRRALQPLAAVGIGAGLGVAIGIAFALSRGPDPAAVIVQSSRFSPAPVRPPALTVIPAPAPLPLPHPAPAPLVQPAPAPKVVARMVPPAPLPAGTPGPIVESDGRETTALVPVTGSTDGMTHHSLIHPRGLAVNLPDAQTVLSMGVHPIDRDGLRFVWIREREQGGLQIRFIFTNPPPNERLLELEEDAVRIRVRRQQEVAATTRPAEL